MKYKWKTTNKKLFYFDQSILQIKSSKKMENFYKSERFIKSDLYGLYSFSCIVLNRLRLPLTWRIGFIKFFVRRRWELTWIN
uniref:Uncharacterized protein n=1 Tax=Rhizoctonia solani TaxID=456999 RepID=N0A761_9AGAM|nr:hypothetical protein RSOL_m01640 [Rhizoctonia solani]AGK45472.1 hypothetical protein RSOL_m01640 [Rhizoctonia solani]